MFNPNGYLYADGFIDYLAIEIKLKNRWEDGVLRYINDHWYAVQNVMCGNTNIDAKVPGFKYTLPLSEDTYSYGQPSNIRLKYFIDPCNLKKGLKTGMLLYNGRAEFIYIKEYDFLVNYDGATYKFNELFTEQQFLGKNGWDSVSEVRLNEILAWRRTTVQKTKAEMYQQHLEFHRKYLELIN